MEIRLSLIEGMSRTACRAAASTGWKLVRKMGWREAVEGSAIKGWLDVEVCSLYQDGGMECLGCGGWDVFEEAILTVEVPAELTIEVYGLYTVE